VADQGKWFKLWESALDDLDLENLTVHEWFCWARFGVYMKKHGKDGKIRLRSPARALTNLFRTDTFDAAIETLKRFPNCNVGERKLTVSPETFSTVTYEVEVLNWHKYQGDFSSDRVRKFRDKKRHRETLQEERRRRRDVEEKRREDTSPQPPTTLRFQKPTAPEVTSYAKTIGFELDGGRFCDYYESKGWKIGSSPMKSWQAAVRTWKQKRDEETPNGTHGSPSPIDYAALARAKREAEALRTVPPPRSISSGNRDLPDVQAETERGEGSGHGGPEDALPQFRKANLVESQPNGRGSPR
jgi:hypothetical protein